jgi:phage/conjugal plasmid C-4 type zinc finger TraR family protein
MAGGWARDGATQEQIDATVEDAVKQIRASIPKGQSLMHCKKCDAEIPRARREAVPGVRFCIYCQSRHEKQQSALTGINRRGSKDSQLR